jgi:hypothetical protein
MQEDGLWTRTRVRKGFDSARGTRRHLGRADRSLEMAIALPKVVVPRTGSRHMLSHGFRLPSPSCLGPSMGSRGAGHLRREAQREDGGHGEVIIATLASMIGDCRAGGVPVPYPARSSQGDFPGGFRGLGKIV